MHKKGFTRRDFLVYSGSTSTCLILGYKNSNADEFAWSLLREQSVATMPGSSFGENGKNYLRLSLTVPDKVLKEACDRIKLFIKQINFST